jgi:hypothetical protein
MFDDEEEAEDAEAALRDIEQAVQSVEQAVRRVEKAVNDKWSTVHWFGAMLIGAFLWSLPATIWHAKWRYALDSGVSSDKVLIDSFPHDCAFLAAPLGEKYCHYEREVSTIWWSTSARGNPIVSYDEGKTWSAFSPDATATVPKVATVEEVHISWKKIDE